MIKTKKKIWLSTSIVSMPYAPFQPGDETERSVIDQIANRVITVSKNEQRKAGSKIRTEKFNFDLSTCIVGINISAITDTQASYLENLSLITHIYPFSLVNCGVSEKALFSLSLHEILKKRNYILPVLGPLPATDALSCSDRYGEEFLKLISGKCSSISLNGITEIEKKFRCDELKSRFPGLIIKDDDVKYCPEIHWLGSHSNEMSKALTHLFHNGRTEFDPKELCDTFNLNHAEFSKYIQESMLFYLKKDNLVIFRFQKQHVLLDFMRELVLDFEREMARRHVIDTTYSNFKTFSGRFVEYHSVGKIFERRDTYGLNLLSYVRQCLSNEDYTKLVILDNGNEYGLCELITKVFPNIQVARLINYFEDPILLSFDTLTQNDKVVVISDLVNSGRFLTKSLQYIQDITHNKVKSVFSFIINTKLNTKFFYTSKLIDDTGSFYYYIKKDLEPLENLNTPPHSKRFSKACGENYRFFWDTINQLCNCSIKFDSDIKNVNTDGIHAINTHIASNFHMEFKNNLPNIVNHFSPFENFLKRIIEQHNISAVIFTESSTMELLSPVLTKIKDNISSITYAHDNAKEVLPKSLSPHKNICLFTKNINLGHSIIDTVNEIKLFSQSNSTIHLISIFSQNNAVRDMSYLSSNIYAKLEHACNSIDIFYKSRIPYYVMDSDATGSEYELMSLSQL